MRPMPGLLYPAAVALLLGAGVNARADLVHWTYNWSRSPVSIAAGTGGVSLTDEPLAHGVGSSDIIATNLKVFSSATADAPDHITNGAYTLNLTLTDDVSHQSSVLTFTGMLGGTFSKDSAAVTNTFTGTTSQTVVLGGNTYTVAMGQYTPPGPTSAANFGSISAHVDVQGAGTPPHHGSPEPSTMMLAGLGLSCLGLASWKRWRR